MTKDLNRSGDPIVDLIELMRRLRSPDGGCPWDIEQTFETIAPYTIEEAYEVADAIQRKNIEELKEELGDLFLQVVFHSQIATDQGFFSIQDVAQAIVDKMVRRHPHVFGDTDIKDADHQTRAWEAMKAEERATKGLDEQSPSALEGVAIALPALMRAEKLLKRAARTGFDWPDISQVVDKLEEELTELSDASKTHNKQAVEEEMGDVLFVVANLARKHGVDPEAALRRANDKFEHRFRLMEEYAISDGATFSELSLSTMEQLWKRAKDTR